MCRGWAGGAIRPLAPNHGPTLPRPPWTSRTSRPPGHVKNGKCEKGKPMNRIVETKNLPPEMDRVAQIHQSIQQQDNVLPQPGDYGFPDETGPEDGRPHVNGQTSAMPPSMRDIVLWRPCRPGFEDRANPPSILVFFNDDEDNNREQSLREEAVRAWPDLAHTNWINVPIWATLASTIGLDTRYSQMVAIDNAQYPQFGNWRGGIVNIEIGGPPPLPFDVDTGPLATRVPLRYEDLMIQLNLHEDAYMAIVFVDGVPLRPAAPGLIFGHGFYMEVVLRPTETSSHNGISSSILRDLLRTPSVVPHDMPLEGGESETPGETDASLGTPRSDASSSPRRTERNTESENSVSNQVSPIQADHHSSPFVAPRDDTRVSQRSLNGSVGIPIALADLIESDPATPRTELCRPIRLEILIPESCAHTTHTVRTPHFDEVHCQLAFRSTSRTSCRFHQKICEVLLR